MSRAKREEFEYAALSYRRELLEALRKLPQSMPRTAAAAQALDFRINLLNRLDNQAGYSLQSAVIDSGLGDRGAAAGQDLATAKSSDS